MRLKRINLYHDNLSDLIGFLSTVFDLEFGLDDKNATFRIGEVSFLCSNAVKKNSDLSFELIELDYKELLQKIELYNYSNKPQCTLKDQSVLLDGNYLFSVI